MKTIMGSLFIVLFTFSAMAQEQVPSEPKSIESAPTHLSIPVAGQIPPGQYNVSGGNTVSMNGALYIGYKLTPTNCPNDPVFEQYKIDRNIFIANMASSALALYGIKKFEYDKAKHFLAGYVIGNIATAEFQLFLPQDMKNRKLVAALLGFGTSVLIGTGKEVWDSMGHGNSSRMDAYATFAGGALGTLTMNLTDVKNVLPNRLKRRTLAPL